MATFPIPCVCFVFACFASYFPCEAAEPESERLLVMLVDGFRYDYLNQSGVSLPGFAKLAKMGVKAEAFVPDFPSLSYPNYYSIMTGLHTESHGMTGNFMYDVTRKEYFLIGANPDQYHAHWWADGEPVWIGAVRQNLKSHFYYWPGCEVEIRGRRPTLCVPYSGVPTFHNLSDAIDSSLDLLRQNQTNLAGIYFELTDKMGHKKGPFSDELNDVIRNLDRQISDLVDRLSAPDLAHVNFMIFADHGMTETSPGERVIDLWRAVNNSDGNVVVDMGAVVSIFPADGTETQLYDKLRNFHPNMSVYRKSDLPDRWHYKDGRYVAPLTAVADLGWLILSNASEPMAEFKGFHGYDNKHREMQGIFLAMGPSFKAGEKVERLRVTDAYQVMCKILGMEAAPNNGSWSDVIPLLDVSHASSVTFNALIISALSAVSLLLFFCLR